ncbi:MAG: ATP-binding protein [Armatimonadetes bacterium]|nr:ATP-binding protein [Armatimonadota bacterium]
MEEPRLPEATTEGLMRLMDQLTDQIREEEARFRMLITKSADSIVVVDGEGVVRYVNPAAESLLGHGANELLGKPFGFPLLATEFTEIEVARPDGRRFADMRVADIEWEEAEATLVSLRDTTEHKLFAQERLAAKEIEAKNAELAKLNSELSQTLEDLHVSQRQLIRSERLIALGRVVGGVAHELNNPLMGVLNYVQYCMERTEEDDPRYSRMAKAIKELERCGRIVNNMLSTSRTIAREDAGEVEPVDCRGVITNAVSVLDEQFRSGGIGIELDLAGDLPAVYSNPDHIMQILLNLLTNSRDAVVDADRKRITIRARRENGTVAISITDTGCGMSDEVLEHMFDPFFTTKGVGKGMGLGMALSRNLVDQMGGTIEVESKVGEGTTVTIRLPIGAGATSADSQPAEHPDNQP